MSIGANLRVLLRAHRARLRATAAPSPALGAFAGRIVIRAIDGHDVPAWVCDHDHLSWGLAYVCALDELDELRDDGGGRPAVP